MSEIEPMRVAEEIETCIKKIESLVKDIPKAAGLKANATAEYDKAIAIITTKLRTDGTPATLIPTLAKGSCYEQKLEMTLREALYKGLITTIQANEAILNGKQSIFSWIRGQG